MITDTIAMVASSVIVFLVMWYIAYRISKSTFDPFDLSNFSPATPEDCQIGHRHLWEKTGEFPETVVGLDDKANYVMIGIFACPVCLDDREVPIPRVDTLTRHKGTYDEA